MGLEAVKEEVISHAREQFNSLIAEGRKEAQKIMIEAEKKIAEMMAKSESETKRITEAIKRKGLASAELENKKITLETKKQLIETVFVEAGKKLVNTDDKKRELYLQKILDKAKNEIEIATVYCNKKDSKLLKGINPKSANIIGGLIAENK